MDSFSTKKTKTRKVKRHAKKSRVQTILDLIFRAMEIIVIVVTVAKLCCELVITFHDSGVAAVILANRNLAFAVGNAIVIALIARSGLLLNQEVVPKCKSDDLYEEFVRESSRRDGVAPADMRDRGKQSEAENEAKQSITETKQSEAEKETQSISDQVGGQTVTEKKARQSISEKRETQSIAEHQEITVSVKEVEKQNLAEKKQIQSYQRSRSENLESLKKSSCGRLRRSETDASSERFDSDDELRYKIESFIARQRRNHNND